MQFIKPLSIKCQIMICESLEEKQKPYAGFHTNQRITVLLDIVIEQMFICWGVLVSKFRVPLVLWS